MPPRSNPVSTLGKKNQQPDAGKKDEQSKDGQGAKPQSEPEALAKHPERKDASKEQPGQGAGQKNQQPDAGKKDEQSKDGQGAKPQSEPEALAKQPERKDSSKVQSGQDAGQNKQQSDAGKQSEPEALAKQPDKKQTKDLDKWIKEKLEKVARAMDEKDKINPPESASQPRSGSPADPRHQERPGALQLQRRLEQLEDLKKKLDQMNPEDRARLFKDFKEDDSQFRDDLVRETTR